MHRAEDDFDVVVVGAGLAGLAASVFLARSGRSVLVLEKADRLGGRATTRFEEGFCFNQGPHALYRKGRATAILRELGVSFRGGTPQGGLAVRDGTLHFLPQGPRSLMATGLLSPIGKLEAARFLASLPRLDTAPLQRVSGADWLARHVRRPEVRELIEAFWRVSSYSHDPNRLSSGAALEQLQIASGGVRYLDGGWQQLVEGLREAAEASGVRMETRARVMGVERDPAVEGVRLAGGEHIRSSAVLLAVDPKTAASLVLGSEATGFGLAARDAAPARVACLDLALKRLPEPEHLFAIGIDRPLYFSVHSAVARLAPAQGAVIHAARYLLPGEAAGGEVEAELEKLVEQLQPGWRSWVVRRRFVPQLTVANALPAAERGGTAGRPSSEVLEIPGLFLAGEWIGPEGLLADASLASARAAAFAIRRAGDRPDASRQMSLSLSGG
jgi:phytoene dehydrogenase-like protein